MKFRIGKDGNCGKMNFIIIINPEYKKKNDHKSTVVFVYNTNAHAKMAKLAGIA